MGFHTIVGMWVLTIISIILTEVMLNRKTTNNTSKKLIFWIVTLCITLCVCGLYDLGIVQLPSAVAVCIVPLLMIPVRVVFELVLMGADIEKKYCLEKQTGQRAELSLCQWCSDAE